MEKKINKQKDLSIIVVNFNTKDITLNCLKSIKKYTAGVNYEIILIDNASSDGSQEFFKKQKPADTQIYNRSNVGFAAANNQGIQKANGRYVLFLNSDTKISSNLLSEFIDWMDNNEKVGIVTCKLKGADGKIQEAGGYFPSLLTVFSWMTIQDIPFVDTFIKPFHPLKKKSFLANNDFFNKEQSLDWVIGAFMLVRKEVLEDIGDWDKDYFMYTEDVDICFRAKKNGWVIKYLPDWEILHYGGASSETREFPLLSEFSGLKRFYKKHYPRWQYPLLRLFLKIGTLGRMVLFAILEGKENASIYAKAFREV